jgi:serine/threonine-protein kinase RsbW
MVRRALAQAVSRFAGSIGADEAGTLELALAEVLNNIVEHAYAGRAAGPVHLQLLREAGTLACRIEDRGRPMPGLALPVGRMPSVDGPVEDLAEGGWGWALIRAVTSDLSYERIGGRNRLCFRLPLSGPDTAAAAPT